MRHPQEGSDDSGSEGSELAVALDPEGRVVFGDGDGTQLLDYKTRTLINAVSPASSTQRHAVQREIETALVGESFWLPADQAPRCMLERMAAQIFAFHTRGGGFDRGSSGAEWWVQRRERGDEEETIGWHWDKDEYAVDAYQVNIHPHLSTVTYLSDGGAPTVVLDKRTVTEYDSAAWQAGDEQALFGPIAGGHVSLPVFGKHLVFDGRLLHGAPSELVPPAACVATPASTVRLTLLVNVWLQHVPRSTFILPKQLLRAMPSAKAAKAKAKAADGRGHGAADATDATDAAPADPARMRLHSATAEAPAAVPPATSTARTVVHNFLFGGSDGNDHLLTLPLPPVKLLYKAALRGSSTFELRLSGAALSAPPGRSDDSSPSPLEPQDEADNHRRVEEWEEEEAYAKSTGERRKGAKKAGASARGAKRTKGTPPPTAAAAAAAAAAAVMDEYDFESHDFQGESRQPLLGKPGRRGGGATTAKAAKAKAKAGGGGAGKATTRVTHANTLTPKVAAARTAKGGKADGGGGTTARRALPAAAKSRTTAQPSTKRSTPTTEPAVPRARAAKRSKGTQPDRRSDDDEMDEVSAVQWRPTHATEFKRGKHKGKRGQAAGAASATPAPTKRARVCT